MKRLILVLLTAAAPSAVMAQTATPGVSAHDMYLEHMREQRKATQSEPTVRAHLHSLSTSRSFVALPKHAPITDAKGVLWTWDSSFGMWKNMSTGEHKYLTPS